MIHVAVEEIAVGTQYEGNGSPDPPEVDGGRLRSNSSQLWKGGRVPRLLHNYISQEDLRPTAG